MSNPIYNIYANIMFKLNLISEWININRVSRQEQYDWFKTLRDADEEDIVHIIRTSPQMITTVMYFGRSF